MEKYQKLNFNKIDYNHIHEDERKLKIKKIDVYYTKNKEVKVRYT